MYFVLSVALTNVYIRVIQNLDKNMEILELHSLMQETLAEAKRCEMDVPVGAIIVKDGEIISRGFNQREQLNDPIGHAEIIAIKQAALKLGSWRLSGCILFCTLEPCPMCAEAAIQSRISKIVFSAYDPVAGAAGTVFNLFANRKALPTPELIGGILEKEGVALLKDFFEQRRKENDAKK